MNKNFKKHTYMFLLNVFFIITCSLTLIPILYAFSIAFSSSNNVLGSVSLTFLDKFTLDNFKVVILEKPYLLWLKNTAILVIATVIIVLSVSVPAAYAFSRFEFKGRKLIIQLLILLNAFPAILSMFAIYRILQPLSLINSRIGLIVIYVGTMGIFGFWNIKGYFDTIPISIEESAKIDGANDFQIISKIILPLARPSIIVTAVMIVIFVWNEYIFSVTFMTGQEKYTLASGLYSLQATQYDRNWPLFSAASLMTSLPILLIFLGIQRHMVSGLTSGGVKG